MTTELLMRHMSDMTIGRVRIGANNIYSPMEDRITVLRQRDFSYTYEINSEDAVAGSRIIDTYSDVRKLAANMVQVAEQLDLTAMILGGTHTSSPSFQEFSLDDKSQIPPIFLCGRTGYLGGADKGTLHEAHVYLYYGTVMEGGLEGGDQYGEKSSGFSFYYPPRIVNPTLPNGDPTPAQDRKRKIISIYKYPDATVTLGSAMPTADVA